MKLTGADYQALTAHIHTMPENASRRERWDALWEATDSGRLGWDVLSNYNDEHIDTALRRISRYLDAGRN